MTFMREMRMIFILNFLLLTDAILGCKKEVPTLDGNVTLTIPAGTQSGDKLRLRGRGVTNVTTKKKGNMYVVCNVIIPEKLSRDQKKLIEQLSKTSLDNDPEFRRYNNYLR